MLASIKRVKELMKLYQKNPDMEMNVHVDFSDTDGMSDIEKSLDKLGFHLDKKCLKRRDTWFDFKGPAGVTIRVDRESGIGFVDLSPNNPAVPKPAKEFTVTLKSNDWDLTDREVGALLDRILGSNKREASAAQRQFAKLISEFEMKR
jgi:hypothetical protein